MLAQRTEFAGQTTEAEDGGQKTEVDNTLFRLRVDRRKESDKALFQFTVIGLLISVSVFCLQSSVF
jgi:hypothetical protein